MNPFKHLALAAVMASALCATAPSWAAEPIDINTASAEVLAESIVGVGPTRAAEIVAYRQLHGPFTSVDDLVLVRGIGKSIVDRSRDGLTVGASQ